MDVCGIDPGLGITGYAILRGEGANLQVMDAGVFRSASPATLADRLVQLADDFEQSLAQWHPEVVGVEQLYAHYRHPRTAIQMAHARGVLLAAARRSGAEVRSFAATEIKQYLTGNGRASKVQVQRAIQAMFRLDAPPDPPDVADAMAVAVCCTRQTGCQGRRVAR